MNTYGYMHFNPDEPDIEFSVLFKINKKYIVDEQIEVKNAYLRNFNFCKIEKIIANNDESNQIVFDDDPYKGITFRWNEDAEAGETSEFAFPIAKTEAAETYPIFEFEDDESALLWFRLNHRG